MADEDSFKPPIDNRTKVTLSEPPDSFTPLTSVPGKDQIFKLPQGPAQPLSNEAVGQAMNYIRPYISGTTGALGSLAGGGFAGGAAGYAIPDFLMKVLNPDQDTRPENKVEAFTDSAKEGLINEIGGKLMQGVFRVGSNLRNAGVPDPGSILKLNPTTAQALENYGYHKLAKVASFMEDYGAPASKAAALDRAGGEGFTQALLLSNQMNSGGRFTKNVFQDPAALRKKILDTLEKGITPGAQPGQFQSKLHYASQEATDLLNGTGTPFEALDDVIGNKDKLNKVLSLGQSVGPKNLNVRKDLQAYYWNRIFDEATTTIPGGGARIDPQKIDQLWFNPKSGELARNLETLYGKQAKGDLDKFMKNIIDSQVWGQTNNLMSKIKYLGGGFSLGGALTGLLGSAGPAVTGGLYLTNGVMGRLLTNPSVGKGVITALTGGPASMGNKILARGIFNALEGTRVAMLDQNQKKTWGSIARQPDGSYQFVGE